VSKLELGDLQVTQIELARATAGATFDLTLSMQEKDSEIRGAFEYNANLFDADTIARMMINFQILLEDIVINSQKEISNLQLISVPELLQLEEWSHA
jgi:non-ribosomal peptide synthetase component F